MHHGDEQQEERHINEGEQAGAGHEVAHGLKVAQVVGVGAGGGGFVRHAQLHDAAEKRGGDDEVGFFARDVGQVTTDEFGEKFEEDGERDADTQHPQGFHGFVRDDAVIDVHHVKRADQREEVDEEGGDDDLVVVAAETPDDAPEPAFRQFVFGQFGADVFRRLWFDKPGIAEVLRFKLCRGEALFANAGKFNHGFVASEFFQYRCFAVAQQNDRRQCQLRDFA